MFSSSSSLTHPDKQAKIGEAMGFDDEIRNASDELAAAEIQRQEFAKEMQRTLEYRAATIHDVYAICQKFYDWARDNTVTQDWMVPQRSVLVKEPRESRFSMKRRRERHVTPPDIPSGWIIGSCADVYLDHRPFGPDSIIYQLVITQNGTISYYVDYKVRSTDREAVEAFCLCFLQHEGNDSNRETIDKLRKRVAYSIAKFSEESNVPFPPIV